jgi:hypothetical protein
MEAPSIGDLAGRYLFRLRCRQQARGAAAGKFPLIVGITGHRDIAPLAHDAVAETGRQLLQLLSRQFGSDVLYLLSALAQGADQLVADIVDELGMNIIAVSPMPLDAYRATMEGDVQVPANFERHWNNAELALTLPRIGTDDGGDFETLQYDQLGAVLCRYSHVLIALWDGSQRWETLDAQQRHSGRGGTAHVVYLRAHSEREANGFRLSRLFAEADSRLDIAHGGPTVPVVTPRIRTGGSMAPLQGSTTRAGDCIMLGVVPADSRKIGHEGLGGGHNGINSQEILFGKTSARELRHLGTLKQRSIALVARTRRSMLGSWVFFGRTVQAT